MDSGCETSLSVWGARTQFEAPQQAAAVERNHCRKDESKLATKPAIASTMATPATTNIIIIIIIIWDVALGHTTIMSVAAMGVMVHGGCCVWRLFIISEEQLVKSPDKVVCVSIVISVFGLSLCCWPVVGSRVGRRPDSSRQAKERGGPAAIATAAG